MSDIPKTPPKVHLLSETHPNARLHTGTFLYVIGPKRGPVKIGISGSAYVRLAQLQTGHPYELAILGEVAVPHNGRESEDSIHKFLLPYRVRQNGEWFHRTHEVELLIGMVASKLSPDLIMEKLRAARGQWYAENRASYQHQRRDRKVTG